MGAGTAAFHTPPAERCRRAGRYNGAVPRDAARMPNPLHDPQPLPQFMAIHAEHVEPAVRELLSANRARIAQLASLSRPTFTTLVEPLEELHHRTSRTWSPVSHLNAVMNSEALREATTPACRCCRRIRPTSRRASRCTTPIAPSPSRRAQRSRPYSASSSSMRCATFAWPASHLPADRKQRFKTAMLELAQLQAKFEENVLDATNSWSRHVTDPAELRGLNEMLIEQARRRAREKGAAGWILSLDQPTYVAVVTDAESESLRRAFYEAWSTRASDQGPSAGRWDNAPLMEEILRRRHESAQLLDFPSFAHYALATRMAHSVEEVLASCTS